MHTLGTHDRGSQKIDSVDEVKLSCSGGPEALLSTMLLQTHTRINVFLSVLSSVTGLS